MDNYDKKNGLWQTSPPLSKIQKFLWYSWLQKQKFTLQKNGLNKKNYSEHAEYFLHYVSKSRLFLAGGASNVSAKKFFDALPNKSEE